MSDVPAALLPYLLGQKTDYGSMQSALLQTNVTFSVAIIVTVGLRFVVRFLMLRSAGLDDLFMALALVFALLLSMSCFVGLRLGLGKHLWGLSDDLTQLPDNVARDIKSLFGCYLAYASAITFTKFSIMATYMRVLPSRAVRAAIFATGAVVAMFWITSVFAIVFTCVPVQAAWDFRTRSSRCIRTLDYFYVAAAFNIATDLVLCFLPLPTIWRLEMPRVQRLVVCVLFSMGSFACIASMLRLTQLYHLGDVDVSYQSAGSLNWSVIEVGTAIICTSVSALRPLASRLLPSIFPRFTSVYDTGGAWTESASKMAGRYDQGQIHVRHSVEMAALPTPPDAVKVYGAVYCDSDSTLRCG